MAFEKRDMEGSLFRNDKKDPGNPDHEKFGDYTGQVMIRGEEFWLTAWLNVSKNGKKYFKIAVRPKDQQQRGAPQGGGNGQRQQAPQAPQGNNQYANQRGGGQQGGRPQRGPDDWNRDPGPESDIPF